VRSSEMFTSLSRGLLFVCLVGYASCRPEAEAQPDADAQMPNAYLDTNGQLVTGGMSSMPAMPGAYPDANGNIIGNGLGPWGGPHGGGDPCTLECCNIVQQDDCSSCTQSKRNCYYVNKQVCPEQSVQGNCRKTMKTHFEQYVERQCRNIQEMRYVNVPFVSCKNRKEEIEVTFNFTRCDREKVPVSEDVSLEDETVVQGQQQEKCIKVQKCRMEERTETRTRNKQEQRCEQVPIQRRQCTSTVIEQPPLIQTKVIYDTVSTPVCRRIPKTVCSPTGCTETGCEDSRYPNTCSTQTTQQETVCPRCGRPFGSDGSCSSQTTQTAQTTQNSCISVQRPQCQMGNSCSSGPQICCRTEYQNVCENKIQKVPRTMQVSIPRPPITRPNCTMVTDYKQTCRMVNVPETYEIQVKTCNNYQDDHCFQIPTYNVQKNPRTQTLQAQGERCNQMTEVRTAKVPVNVGVVCQENNKPVAQKVSRRVCDRTIPRTKQVPVQHEICERGRSPQCTVVPELVCPPEQPQPQPQPTPCQNVYRQRSTQMCNVCKIALDNGVPTQCPTKKCQNYSPQSIMG